MAQCPQNVHTMGRPFEANDYRTLKMHTCRIILMRNDHFIMLWSLLLLVVLLLCIHRRYQTLRKDLFNLFIAVKCASRMRVITPLSDRRNIAELGVCGENNCQISCPDIRAVELITTAFHFQFPELLINSTW